MWQCGERKAPLEVKSRRIGTLLRKRSFKATYTTTGADQRWREGEEARFSPWMGRDQSAAKGGLKEKGGLAMTSSGAALRLNTVCDNIKKQGDKVSRLDRGLIREKVQKVG